MNNNTNFTERTARAISPDFTVDQSNEDAQLWINWISLWNGVYSLASQVVSSKLTLHANLLGGQDPSTFNTPEALVSLIDQIRTAIPDLTFAVTVGPIMAGGHLVGHWNASGHYAGHFPGAIAKVGTEISFNGTDILRIEDGKIAEYWLVSDSLGLITQLGVKM